ncbi:MAG TPA: phosphomannomutase/phosphoglucomutase, partial [Thermopetrobacter sp.]|nr:phosphomannomutase/phosphoglucomutase [Thermopetrobacter sp.]
MPAPRAEIAWNTPAYENEPLVAPTGFREYDARWLFFRRGKDGTVTSQLNLLGARALGLGLGTFLHDRGVRPEVVVGHDYREYSASIKNAVVTGLLAAGCTVHDIGLALSPMAYFAQFELDVPGVAMVTASHNENGWTGVKMGCEPPLTFGPGDMAALRDLVLEGKWRERDGGRLVHHP